MRWIPVRSDNPSASIKVEPPDMAPEHQASAPASDHPLSIQISRRRALTGFGVAGLAGLAVLSGCTTDHPAAKAGASGSGSTSSSTPPLPEAAVVIDPADGAADVAPVPVMVTATGGKLTTVELKDDKGAVLAGELAEDALSWSNTDPMAYGSTYTITATAANEDSKTTTKTETFSTVTPKALAYPSIGPLDGTTVGVGMPIRIYFTDTAVTDRKAVQAALKVEVTPKQMGSWNWISDTEVHWRPQVYWNAGAKVTVTTSLFGVDFGGGVWGKPNSNREISFTIGKAQVSKANTQSHQMQVFQGGQLVRTIPIAAGKEEKGRYTHNGTHVVLEKRPKMTMNSETFGLALDAGGYNTEVQWATRISNNGEFVHSAPWSIADQGVRNVSHGCLNASPENAKWFLEFSQIGDPVEVSGSPVPLTKADGDIFDWTIPWETWKKGSAD